MESSQSEIEIIS